MPCSSPVTRPDPAAFDSFEAYCDAIRSLPWRTPGEELALASEALDWAEESHAECVTQYRSECALFGDAGPGQGLAVQSGSQLIHELRAKVDRLRRICGNLSHS